MYLCKKQVNNSYFKGIDETEDYTTVETYVGEENFCSNISDALKHAEELISR